MTSTEDRNARAALWQGFHHAWEYNHRLNRFGSYVRTHRNGPSPTRLVVGHTAASGTGNDMAHFAEFVTDVSSARGVAFQSGVVEVTAECQRGDLTPFIVRVDDLDLAPELHNRDVYTVVLNGFDLYAAAHAEKLVTFDLEITDPTVTGAGTKIRFRAIGNLKFDCRSPECQLLPLRLESERCDRRRRRSRAECHREDLIDAARAPTSPIMPEPRDKRGIDRHRVDRAVHWLKRKVQQLTGVEEVKRSIIGEDGDTLRRRLFRLFGREFYFRFLKWRLSAPYVLRVHYLIIAGDREALTVTESPRIDHAYTWGLDEEIRLEDLGTVEISVPCEDPTDYAVNTLAFKHIYLDVVFDEEVGSEDPIQWGKGMHMLEWHMAIRDISVLGHAVTAKLDLFYKNWSEAMNEVITLTTWGAVRAAGRADVAARLALLQMREAISNGQHHLPGRIYWPGGGLSARSDPRARWEQVLPEPQEAEA